MTSLRDPSMREHFVYRAYDEADNLLYAGCTARLNERHKAHRCGSDWFHLAVRFHLSGPYNYDVARQLERDTLRNERPLYAFGPERRSVIGAHRRIARREAGRLMRLGYDIFDAWAAGYEHADSLVPYPGNRQPFVITDLTVPAALRADALDATRAIA